MVRRCLISLECSKIDYTSVCDLQACGTRLGYKAGVQGQLQPKPRASESGRAHFVLDVVEGGEMADSGFLVGWG